MMPEAKNDVLNALKEAIAVIKEKQYAELHDISDHVLHVMAVYQESDIVDMAVAVYALSKILETERYKAHPKMSAFRKNILFLLQKAAGLLGKDRYGDYADTLKEILESIDGFSKSIKFYIEDILHFARTKKGARLYEHGLSLGSAAELAGVTKWELMPAIGETAIHEQIVTPKEINEKRLKFVEKIFKVRKKRQK